MEGALLSSWLSDISVKGGRGLVAEEIFFIYAGRLHGGL